MAYERCVIFGAGEYYEGPAPAIEKGMLAIAADGGLDHMRAMGLSPDFVIGDFDFAVRRRAGRRPQRPPAAAEGTIRIC